MPRKYSHIQEHEKEIIELRSQGMTLRQIGEKLGFTYKEMRGFLSRYNRKQDFFPDIIESSENLQQESLQSPRDDPGRVKSGSQVLQNTNMRSNG